MAWDDELPKWLDWSDRTQHAYETAFDAPDEILSDPLVLRMFENAFFEHSRDAEVALINYLFDEYGLEWEDVWDWEAWREAYGEG